MNTMVKRWRTSCGVCQEEEEQTTLGFYNRQPPAIKPALENALQALYTCQNCLTGSLHGYDFLNTSLELQTRENFSRAFSAKLIPQVVVGLTLYGRCVMIH